MLRKGILVLVLAALLILGTAVVSFADPGKGKALGKLKAPAKGKTAQLTDISSHWAEQSILTMCSYGVISGYPDFTFQPNKPVTRDEALLMICRSLGYEDETGLSWGKRLEECLDFAVDNDILDENEAENFNGWKPAKRFEVAVWAVRAIGVDEDVDLLTFRDMDEMPAYAIPYVGFMYKHKYMVGYPGKYFQPNKPVTKAEIASVLYRILTEHPADQDEDNISGELKIVSLDPANGSSDVDEDTDEFVVKFNKEIRAVDDLQSVMEGIRIYNATDREDVDIDEVDINGRVLTIELEDTLESDKTYRVTIKSNVIEAKSSGRYFRGISGSQWEFSTGQAIIVEELTPANGARNVDGDSTKVLEARFNNDIRVISGKSLLNSVRVYNVSEDRYLELRGVEIDYDTLVVTLKNYLSSGDTFEVTIRAGYLEDKTSGEDFDGISGEDWRFKTR